MSSLVAWKGMNRRLRAVLIALLCLGSQAALGQTTVKYVHTDALGSVVAMTDAGGNVVEEHREYEPYGYQMTPVIQDGPGYTGHVEDAATSLTYMQQRYYDPQIGLFLSVDPVTAYSDPVGQFNRYRYANNNPYKFTDPDGRMPQFVWGAVIGVGVELIIQTTVQGRSFSNLDYSNLGVAALAGGVTAGLASANALRVANLKMSVGAAVGRTSLQSGAVASAASAAKDVANGEAPDAQKMIVDGVAGAALGYLGQKATLGPALAAEGRFSRGGLSSTVQQTTDQAIQGGPASGNMAAATSNFGANASDALNSTVDYAKSLLEERP